MVLLFTGWRATRQPLFSVILSRYIYLCMFVCRFLPLQSGWHSACWCT